MTSESSGTRRDRHHVMDGLLLWTAVAWWQGRKFKVNEALAPVKWAQAAIYFIAILIIFVLLGAVLSPQPMSAQDIEKQMHDLAQQDEAAEPQLGRPEQAK